MSKFVVRELKEFDGKQIIAQLFINGKSLVEEFIEECKSDGNLQNEIDEIQTRLERLSNLEYDKLPRSKFRELSGRKKSDHTKDFEIKTKNLRVYLCEMLGGRLLILGGRKSSQPKEIKRMRSIKIEFIKSI